MPKSGELPHLLRGEQLLAGWWRLEQFAVEKAVDGGGECLASVGEHLVGGDYALVGELEIELAG